MHFTEPFPSNDGRDTQTEKLEYKGEMKFATRPWGAPHDGLARERQQPSAIKDGAANVDCSRCYE
jgi:hypothetical protein